MNKAVHLKLSPECIRQLKVIACGNRKMSQKIMELVAREYYLTYLVTKK